MSERCGFRFHQNEEVYWFWPIDRPIHENQKQKLVDAIESEVHQRMAKPRSKQARLTKKWYQHLDNITHDGYGSFRLDFDYDGMDALTDAELQDCYEDILNLVVYSPIIETIRNWIGIEEDLEDFIECHGAEDAMTYYIDAVLESGYRLHQRDVEEMFMPHITAQAIANDFLFRKLKGQDVVCKEVKQELAVA